MTSMSSRLLVPAVLAAALAACGGSNDGDNVAAEADRAGESAVQMPASDAPVAAGAAVMLEPTEGNQTRGELRFAAVGDRIEVTLPAVDESPTLAVVAEPVPDRLRRVEVEARQHHRAFGQLRHRLHEQPRRAMRPGRADDDDRPVGQVLALGPVLAQDLGRQALTGGTVRRRAFQMEAGGDAQEAQGVLPMPGMIAGVDAFKGVGAKSLGLHLVHQG